MIWVICYVWIDVDDLSITLILEQQAFDVLGYDLIVGRVVRTDHLILPVVVAQVGRPGQEFLFAAEIWLEIFGLEAMSKVYIARDLLSFGVSISYEYYRLGIDIIWLDNFRKLRVNIITVIFPVRLASSRLASSISRLSFKSFPALDRIL